ncbi:A/G-specific adenine glycosylase [Xanthobacter autotrophicus]|uniref:A/G-specific adenine glycosylase n=1 Tax=Xanthobacter TaxID=279 RepID=UPI0024AB5DA6|nr:A/G-specific adenine glycosylase [Xanthobacter autotrophicus]MDI4665843.1 A/G-specific adenine glycosylase [Xanthobacter autotrophicus]
MTSSPAARAAARARARTGARVGSPAAPKAAPRPGEPDPAALLDWYDRHRRRLPWRAEPGRRADPYHVFLSEIMLQQTTVKAVGPYFGAFLARWPSVSHLAAAPLEEVLSAWAGLGYYARARNLHACAKAVVARHGGRFPKDEEALLALPGIGPYTAAAIAAIAFDRPASPVDGNIERVISRLHAIAEPLPGAKGTIKARAAALTPAQRPGDFAQAMMDLGATICTPKSPACSLCPWMEPCVARAQGDAASYPVKAPKGEKPRREGTAFLAVRVDGAVLLRTRPDKGLLAKMTEVPSTPWDTRAGAKVPARPEDHAPLSARWRPLPGVVEHVFTHFALTLAVRWADLPASTPAPDGHRWVRPEAFGREALPSVMRKVLAHGGIG